MEAHSKSYPKAVVALAGVRDRYQLPLALSEAGLLRKLVTDLYWPADKKWSQSFVTYPFRSERISARYCPGLSSDDVKISKRAVFALASEGFATVLRRYRLKDTILSRRARQVALQHGAALFCCSYYAFDAFQPNGETPQHRFLFQLHPHPRAVRQTLMEELERVPSGSWSLTREYELSLPAGEFEKLASEPHLATGFVVASTYTGRTLLDHGIAKDRIHVVPYGVDSAVFAKRASAPPASQPFTVVFVGSIIQRKGLSYLLEAVRLLKSRNVRIVLCGRGKVDQRLLNDYSDLRIELKLGLDEASLIRTMHAADVFVLASLAEGFGQVILEAMSCGLPIIATSNTGAPDVVTEGKDGFLVPIRDAAAIADKLAWGLDHRAELAAMGEVAAGRARCFTWERFREGVTTAYKQMIDASYPESNGRNA